jgi:tripartite-type tricarboxylate transporter receptor subunit TctC
MMQALSVVGAALTVLGVAMSSASAQSIENFYKGKTVSVIVYTAPGSAYDIFGRMFAHYMPNYIPGHPTMIARNMEGAGGLTATRYLYSTAPKDGTVFGTIARGIAFEPLFGGAQSVDFDPLKFNWLGSTSSESSLSISWYTSDIKTAKDLFVKELLVAGTGNSADSEVVPRTLNGLLGTKFKIISGYQSLTTASLAMERKEIDGVAYWSWGAIKSTKPDWVRDHKLNLLWQTATVPDPEIAEVPTIISFAKTDAQKQAVELLFARDIMARPFLAPPGVPADRVKALKDAFIAVLKDPDLMAEAEKSSLEIKVVTGDEIEALLKKEYAVSPEVVAMTRKAMGR